MSQFKVGDRCRIKTEQEFIAEYGVDWRHKIVWDGHGKMDYLFGENFTIEKITGNALLYNRYYLSKEKTEQINDYAVWNIYDYMLVLKTNKEKIKGEEKMLTSKFLFPILL
jgi:hypothetical protein